METIIVLLRKRKRDGTFYSRPVEIETTIAALSLLPGHEVVARCRIHNGSDDAYVPTECLLHFVRNSSFGNDEHVSYDLFAALLDRLEIVAVPELSRGNRRSDHEPQKMILLEIREAIIEKFQDMLCADQASYDERLDFFECKFNAALANLRRDKRKMISREHARFRPIAVDEESNDSSAEVEEAFNKLRESANADSSDFLYRLKVRAAINSLPAAECQVIELLDQGFPIESEDDEVLSIVKIVGCVEKTVRNRRDRATKRLLEALKEDDA